MNRLLLGLASSSGLIGSALCWLMAMPAMASIEQKVSEPMKDVQEAQVCVMSTHSRFNLVCERVSKLKNEPQVKPVDLATDPFSSPVAFEFSNDESNAAIALFGCDCPACINALRSLRTMPVS